MTTPYEEGSPQAPLCILGEAPAAEEMRHGRPFCGEAGRVLDQCLAAAGISRHDAYIINCFDRSVTKDALRDRAWLSGELVWTRSKGLTDAGLAAMQGTIARLRDCSASIVVPLGGIALWAYMPWTKGAIGKYRGSVYLENGRKAMATYHPATVCWGSTYLQHVIATDLKRAKEQSAFPEVRQRPRDLTLNPTLHDAIGYIEHLSRCQRRTFFDLELYNGQLSAVSLSNHPEGAICIPFLGPEGHRWNEDEEFLVLEALARLLEDPAIPKGNQNVTFDAHILAELYGIIVRGHLDDPMVLHSIVYPDMEKSLAFLASWLTDIPYYKDDGGKRAWQNPWANLEAFWRYSALDACAALECFENLESDFLQSGSLYERTYRETMELVGPLTFMMLRGQRIDEPGLEAEKFRQEMKLKGLSITLREMHPGLNPMSAPQCAKLFYEILGHTPYLKDKKPTTDVHALKRLARKGVQEASLLLSIRSTKKRLSELDVKLRNGRLHTAYNIRGTKTGRLSSEEDEFGDGGNVQNRTSTFKAFIVSDELEEPMT